jgi:putative flippase GtrA
MAPVLDVVRSPRWQVVRFVMAGGFTAVVSIGAVLLLSGPVGLPIQVAILSSYPLLLVMHFSLQRWFVFARDDAYALRGGAQVRRYLSVVAVQYVYVAACTAALVHFADVADRSAYLIAVLSGAAAVFTVMRLRVFH